MRCCFGRPFVKRFALYAIGPLSVCPVCRSVSNVGVLWPNGWMDQDATWHGGGPRPRWRCVRWGPSSPPPPRKRDTAAPRLFGPCLLWPNGWMDQDAIWYGGRPRSRPHCVRWGPSSAQPKWAQQPPTFWPMSVGAKRSPISATAELFFITDLKRSILETSLLFMAALWNRAGHYIFALWFLLSSVFYLSIYLFSSPIISRRRFDVYHTWCGLGANLRCRSETGCTRLAENTGRKSRQKSTFGHHRTSRYNFVGLHLRK